MVDAAKLDKGKRDALPEGEFAVPGKRKLPMHDVHHVKLAWDMIERTQGLTPEEKSSARHRILRKAKELGVNTDDWHKMNAMRLEAMSLNISNADGHPNKMPFSGVLTRIDEPSDEAPHGSGGRRVTVTKAAAEKALGSLLGMAVDYQPTFEGHDPKAKIGIITSANIVGNAITIEGFIYAADFPEVAERIRADKDSLGFSFEAQRIWVADPGSDIVEVVQCEFTGAAILRKDKAAYQSTSIAANAEMEFQMTNDELKAMLGEVVKPISERLDKIEATAKAQTEKLEANAAVMGKVEPHCAALESCSAAMEAAGVGAHPENGHAALLKRMASRMRSEAALGKVPHIFRDHDYPYNASADKGLDGDAVKKAVEEALKPVKAELAAANTKVADLQAAAKIASPAPERKTISPAIGALLAKASIGLPEGDEKLTLANVDKALGNANLTTVQRFQLKNELTRAGVLA